jgi:hypothetical protein
MNQTFVVFDNNFYKQMFQTTSHTLFSLYVSSILPNQSLIITKIR